jgi:hypothetical protein
MRKTLWITSALLAFAVMGSTVARASSAKYSFTITGPDITSSGTITVSTTGTPGVDDVTGITGSYSDLNPGGFSGSISGLVTGSYSATSPTVIAAAPGYDDTFDNLFYPAGASPACGGEPAGALLDGCGITFAVGANDVNLFGAGPGAYGVFDWTPTTVIDDNGPVQATFTETPEPGAFSLTLIGLTMLGFVGVMRKRKIQGLAQAA